MKSSRKFHVIRKAMAAMDRTRRIVGRTVAAGIAVLCGLAAPPNANAQSLIDFKVEVGSDQVVRSDKVPGRHASFTVPGEGRLRVVYRQLKYRGYSPWGGFSFAFPGSASAMIPGRPIGPDSVDPPSPVEGMPYEMVFVRELDSDQANLKIDASLTALGYLQSRGDPPLVYVYAQSTSLTVDWLGSGPGTTPKPPAAPASSTAGGVVGQWSVRFNGQPLLLEIAGNPGSLTGVLRAGGSSEQLDAVSFDAATSALRFARPIGGGQWQLYTGILKGGRLDGFFESGPLSGGFEQGSYRWMWDGERAPH